LKKNTKKLFGLDYQILRPEFLDPGTRDYSGSPKSILVTIGGDDVLGIFPDLLSFFKDRFRKDHPDLDIFFVVGPMFDKIKIDDKPRQFHILQNVKDMRSLIMKADICVSAGGQTIFELARCGIPSIVFWVAENQIPQLEAMANLNAVDYIGKAASFGWLDRLSSSLENLCSSEAKRKLLGAIGPSIIDGQAAMRISNEIQNSVRDAQK